MRHGARRGRRQRARSPLELGLVSALEDLLVDRNGVQRPFSLPPWTARQVDIERLKEEAKALLGPTFRALVHATDIPFMQPIVDVQTRSMRYGRVLLTGDAASVPRPHTVSGTSKAADDAITLAQALSDLNASDDIEGALATWATARRTNLGPLIARGKQLAQSFDFGAITQ